MPISLTVNGVTYEYPSPGENPRWGEDATGWAEEVTALLNTLAGANDIIETSFNVANNQASFADIVGLFFNPAVVRSAVVEYAVYRETDSANVAETGLIQIIYNQNSPATEKWQMTRQYSGSGGLDIQVLDSGQFQYKSSNMAGSGYDGAVSFKARSLVQV